jgi:hypothetical protein
MTKRTDDQDIYKVLYGKTILRVREDLQRGEWVFKFTDGSIMRLQDRQKWTITTVGLAAA